MHGEALDWRCFFRVFARRRPDNSWSEGKERENQRFSVYEFTGQTGHVSSNFKQLVPANFVGLKLAFPNKVP